MWRPLVPARRLAGPVPAPVAALLLVAALAGCGGGVFIGVGGGFDDEPPSVQLAAASGAVAPGQSVRFVAAASDESGVDSVSFFRLDNGVAVLLERDFAPPYEVTVAAPADGRTSLVVFTRARDHEGNSADSAAVSVPITR